MSRSSKRPRGLKADGAQGHKAARTSREQLLGLPRWASRRSFHLGVIVGLGLLAYANAVSTPFQWDDNSMILDNVAVHGIDAVFNPPDDLLPVYARAMALRPVVFFSFALNYALHGPQVPGFHLVNIAIHLINALLIYWLCLLLLATPALRTAKLRPASAWFALSAATLFVTHPLQTMAVTYVYQRLASLVALFYLAAMVFYLASRLAQQVRERNAYFALALVSTVLAMWTKENAFTLPFALAGAEFLLFTGPLRMRLLKLVLFAPTLLIVPLTLLSRAKAHAGTFEAVQDAVVLKHGPSPLTYLLTQFEVLVVYLRLLVLPVGQSLIHEFDPATSLLEGRVFASLSVLVVLAVAAAWLIRRSGTGPAEGRLIGGGILWVFVTASVESSFVPLHIVAQEYRMYLPSVGFFVAVSGAILLAAQASSRARTLCLVALGVAPFVLGAMTHGRNIVWASELSLWQDTVAKAPHSGAARTNLGNVYRRAGEPERAVEQYRAALAAGPKSGDLHQRLAMAYRQIGEETQAEQQLVYAASEEPRHAAINYNLGLMRFQRGAHGDAVGPLTIVVQEDPEHADARALLAASLLALGNLDDAQTHFEAVLRINPVRADVHRNLGLLHLRNEDWPRARGALQRALELDPADSAARRMLNRVDPDSDP